MPELPPHRPRPEVGAVKVWNPEAIVTCGFNSEKGRNFSCCFEARPTDCRLYSRVSPGTINIFHSLTHAIDEILSDIDVVSD